MVLILYPEKMVYLWIFIAVFLFTVITVTTAAQTGGLDLILVPGLAFDLTGGRLGRGKGCVSNKTFNCVLILPRFYDKLLNDYKAIQSDEFKFPQKGTSPRKKWNTANLYFSFYCV